MHLPEHTAPSRRVGVGDRAADINVEAARLARAACDAAAARDGRPRFVAGSMGPTGMLPSSADPTLSAISFGELSAEFHAQAAALVTGGVDVLLIETAQDILEVKAAIAGIERLFAELGRRVALQAQVTLDTSGRMLLGTDIASAMTTLESLGVDVIGLNCSTGPEHMREPIRWLAEHARLPVSCIPNAGLPLNTGTGDAVYPLQPEPLALALSEFVREFGVAIVGGCCGTTPEHLEHVVRHVRDAGLGTRRGTREYPVGVPASRGESRVPSPAQCVPSPAHFERHACDHPPRGPAPLTIGERVNAQESRAVKRMLLANDYEGIRARGARSSGGRRACTRCARRAHRARR